MATSSVISNAFSLTTPFGDGVLSLNSFQGHDEISGRTTTYLARVEPWFALLRMKTDFRIFQNKTVPEIITQIFSDAGMTDFRNSLTGSYNPREYCVQYGETAFDFVSRLMENAGIFYFFE